MDHFQLEYSDFIAYVDESGDHSLTSIDDGYPVFVLSFCVFNKIDYAHATTPALRRLKFETFGHDKVLPFELIIADKKTNSEGLQFADLAARPAGLSVVRPSQLNRAFQILQQKLHKNHDGEVAGYGFHLYPIKSEKPQSIP